MTCRAQGFSSEIVDAIDALTRRDGEDYFDFVRRAKSNAIAKEVKVANLKDNMDMTRLANVSDHEKEPLARTNVRLKYSYQIDRP